MKKALAILTTLLTIMSLTALVAAAEYDATTIPTVQVSSVSGQIGKTVDITISLLNNPGVSSLSFDVFFDESKLTLTNITFNTTLGGQTGSSESVNSPVTIQWVNAFNNWSQDGMFATLTFQIADEVVNNTETEISISYDPDNIYNLLEENVSISVTNGKVNIIPLAGDINGDGKVNNKDVTRLFQSLANWKVTVNQEVLDVNGDGKTNNKDITRLMQYLANWDVKIYYQPVHKHIYGEWISCGDSTHERICSCGDKQLETHVWDEGTVIKNATHTEYGEIRYTCSVCHETKTEQIEKIATHTFGNWTYMNESLHKRICACGSEETDAHSWDEGVVIKEATAIQKGSKKYTCTVCGGTKTEAISTTSYTVKFYSGDEVLDVQAIKHGMSATAPADPEKDGYRFTGWDMAITNITQDVDIHAVFIKTYVVDFIDYNYSVISSQTVDVCGNAIPPQSPTRTNYKFAGWDGNYQNVNADTTVKATYVRTYMVTFVDADSNIIKTFENVEIGSSFSGLNNVPTVPYKEGYNGTWNNCFTDIHENLVIAPVYSIKQYKVTFKMPDGKIIKYVDNYGTEHDYQLVEHGSFAVEPQIPEYYFVWEKNGEQIYRAYGFTSWLGEVDRITTDVEIVANYNSDYNQPIIAVKYTDNYGRLAPSIILCNLSNCKLYGFSFAITYKTNNTDGTYAVNVDEVSFNSAADWLRSGSNDLYDLDINNKAKELHFAWSYGNGVRFDTYGDFISKITIATSGGAETVFTDSFKIDETRCSMIISYDDGVTFQKITPIIIYG